MALLKPIIDTAAARSVLDGLIAPSRNLPTAISPAKSKAKEIFSDAGLSVEYLAGKLRDQIEYSDDLGIRQRAIDTALKVQGAMDSEKEGTKTVNVQFVFNNGHSSEQALAVLIPR